MPEVPSAADAPALKRPMRTRVRRAVDFFQADIWRIRAAELTRRRSFFLHSLRIIVLAVRQFFSHKCLLRASALTYYSILSIIPILALAFGVAKGFGLEKDLQDKLRSALASQKPEIADNLLSFSNNLLQNTHGGIVAGIGIVFLFWTVIRMLTNIETSFNDIWGVKQPRTIARRFTDYLSLVLICPFLFAIMGGLSVILTSHVTAAADAFDVFGIVKVLVFLLLALIPCCIGWAMFAFLYLFLPNTKVRFRSAVIAGIAAGTMYQVVQWVYLTLQIGVTKYNAWYGSFAALPLFLIWLQLSWLVVLFGAELAFAHQNVSTYEFEPDCLRASRGFRRLAALRVMQHLVRAFADGAAPPHVEQVSRETGIPVRLVNDVLYELIGAGLVVETKETRLKDLGYVPARDISDLTVGRVLAALDHTGADTVPVADSKEWRSLAHSLRAFEESIESSPANVLLKDV